MLALRARAKKYIVCHILEGPRPGKNEELKGRGAFGRKKTLKSIAKAFLRVKNLFIFLVAKDSATLAHIVTLFPPFWPSTSPDSFTCDTL